MSPGNGWVVNQPSETTEIVSNVLAWPRGQEDNARCSWKRPSLRGSMATRLRPRMTREKTNHRKCWLWPQRQEGNPGFRVSGTPPARVVGHTTTARHDMSRPPTVHSSNPHPVASLQLGVMVNKTNKNWQDQNNWANWCSNHCC